VASSLHSRFEKVSSMLTKKNYLSAAQLRVLRKGKRKLKKKIEQHLDMLKQLSTSNNQLTLKL
jgi:hypothetical protein